MAMGGFGTDTDGSSDWGGAVLPSPIGGSPSNGNAAIAAALAKRRSLRQPGQRPQDGSVNRGQQEQPQSMQGALNGILIGGYADAGPRLDSAVNSIGGTLNANADRMNQAAIADSQEQGKTRRLGMLMSMMAPMLGGGSGGGGGFMTNFGQAAIPGSFLGMGGNGAGGGMYGAGVPMVDGKPDYTSANTYNSFMRQNMLKTLAGLRGVMGTDPSKLANSGSSPNYDQMFGSY